MKNNKIKQILELVIMLVLIFGILYLSEKTGFADQLKPESKSDKVLMIIGIFIMAFIVLGVHELGHLLTGLYQGFRFDLYVVGPLGIRRETEGIKMYLNKNIGMYGGAAATSPLDDSADNVKIFANILLAGPIASIIFAIFCFSLAFAFGKPFGMILYTGGLISVAIFFATTIPSKTGMFFTDRKRYQRLVTPGPDQNVELAMLNIMGKFAKDNSFVNIPMDDIQTLIGDELPFIKYYGLFNLYCYELELHGQASETTRSSYDDQAKDMPKALVKAFDNELEKYKESLNERSVSSKN